MGIIKDDRGPRFSKVVSLEEELTIQPVMLKKLAYADGQAHLQSLGRMLQAMSQLVYDKIHEGDERLRDYFIRLSDSAQLLAMRHQLGEQSSNKDVTMELNIHPVESGYPVFVRDTYLLNRDKQRGVSQLEGLPNDQQLVHDALFHLFRGFFPHEIVMQKLTRDYLLKLVATDLPAELRSHDSMHVNEEGGKHFYKKPIERFDDHDNLPRLYNAYFTSQSGALSNPEETPQLEQAIQGVLSGGTSEVELRLLAQAIENIPELSLQFVERYDLGPFYNRFTDNPEPIKTLLEQGNENDAVLMLKKFQVVRSGEQTRQGLRHWVDKIAGKTNHGVFSPVILRAQYALMPHRLIQKVHSMDLDLKNTRMYGITSDGGLVD